MYVYDFLLVSILWHINTYELFNAKSCFFSLSLFIYIYIYIYIYI